MASQYVPHTKVPTLVFPTSAQCVRHVALHLDQLIRQHNAAGKATVLGLATGSTPVGLYRELIRLHRETGLDFSRVVTFNLDEYFPMPTDSPHSYRRWMHETLFQHLNIAPENIHIPDGTVHPDQADDHCLAYEQAIRKAGGLDVQILGIGRTGHIGFNEPGATRNSRTRMVLLDPVTRRDAASSFFGLHHVPLRALTMGVGSILDAKQIILMAFGEHKAKVVQQAVEADPTDAVPASYLQRHPDCTFILDQPAAAELTAIRRPWEVGPVTWTPERTRQAVMWLSLTTKKALLKLTDADFAEHGLYELVREHGPAQALGRRIFADRMATVIAQPAGETPCDVLVFSPHPDDDVISMGGTLIRLVEGQHRVQIAYMTSGNFAVFDHDARRFADFVASFNDSFGIDPATSSAVRDRIITALDGKCAGQCDSADVLAIKGLIRATEARAAALACGIPASQLTFMDLRFYRTGTAAKAPLHPQDVVDVIALLQRVQPKQIYLAGEMSDPHGTHRICAEAIFQAVRQVRNLGQQFDVWLYRGAWEEWEPHEIELAVPLSPGDLDRKKDAIFRHQSQKDRAMFPGTNDPREFWQRAEERNRGTAQIYDALGLPEYFALEAFVRWKDA